MQTIHTSQGKISRARKVCPSQGTKEMAPLYFINLSPLLYFFHGRECPSYPSRHLPINACTVHAITLVELVSRKDSVQDFLSLPLLPLLTQSLSPSSLPSSSDATLLLLFFIFLKEMQESKDFINRHNSSSPLQPSPSQLSSSC